MTRADVFAWPTATPGPGDLTWRARAEGAMAGLIRCAAGEDALQLALNKPSEIIRLTELLTMRGQTETPDADGAAADRQAVTAYLGWTLWQHDQIANLGLTHIKRWMDRLTALSWDGVAVTKGRGASAVWEAISETGLIPSNSLDIYKPWTTPSDDGLHGDLVALLKSFITTAEDRPQDYPLVNLQLAKSCVLFRALATVAPERVPASTVELLDRVEGRLDMDALLRGGTRITPEVYGLIRATWDQSVLEKVDLGGTGPSAPARRGRRTL